MVAYYDSLQQIARDGHLEELEEYLQSRGDGSNLDQLDDKRNSALHYASRYSHLKLVEVLLSAEYNITVDNVGADGMTPLHYATRYGKNVVGGCEREEETVGDREGQSFEKVELEVKDEKQFF